MLSSGSYLLPPDSDVRADDPVIIAFYALQIIGGNVLIPAMFLASFVQGTKYSRSPIFINFCVGWIVYSIGFLLSFYSGRWRRDVEPIPWLCEIQVMVYVSPIWTAATTLALIFELWTGVTGRRRSSSTKEPRARFPLRTLVLFIFPYFCAAFMAIAAGLVSQSRPDLVGLRLIFCAIDFRPLRTTVSILCALALASAFALQFDIGRHIYGNKPSFRTTRSQDWYLRALFVRMLIFCIVVGVGSLAALFSSLNSYDYPRLIIQATFPLAVWLVFGTNPAIYKRESGSVPISKA